MRWEEMEADGSVAEVVFPNTVPPFFPTGAVIAGPPTPDEFEHRLAGIRAHNRWLADFVSEAPERRAGVGQIFLNDVDEAIADVQWIKEHGISGGALLPGRPDDATWVAPIYDPVLRPAVGGVPGPRRHHHPPRRARARPTTASYPAAGMLWVAETAWFSHRAAHAPDPRWRVRAVPGPPRRVHRAGLLMGPGHVDASSTPIYMGMKSGRVGELKPDDDLLPLSPSEYFNRNCYVGRELPEPERSAGDEEGRARARDVGQRLPAPRRLPAVLDAKRSGARSRTGLPTRSNRCCRPTASEVYGFDVAALAGLAARFGPTVDEIAVPLDEVPKDSGSPAFYRP